MRQTRAPKYHRSNRLLAALEPQDFAYLAPHLEIVELQKGQVLCETGETLNYAYFPHDTVISLVAVMKDGSSAEMAICGREGVVGLLATGVTRQSFGRYVAQLTGTASRITIDELYEVIDAHPNIRLLMQRFMEAMTARVLQSVACNAVHSAEARCARWILSTRHRIDQSVLPLTHEYLAERLGVQRSTVSVVMGKLQTAGLIRQGRGGITVTDPKGLEEAACECFRRLYDIFERLLPHTFTKGLATSGDLAVSSAAS
jgi:CRP-like cAMP-binding protein